MNCGIDTQRTIFRADALQRYMQGRERSVLPQFVSPRTFLCLWILLGLLVAAGFVAWFAQVPVYAAGPAIVVEVREPISFIHEEVVVAIFLPPEHLRHLRAGQPMFLTLEGLGERIRTPILAVEPGISSPMDAQRRFALSAATAVNRPAVVAIARLGPLPAGLSASTYIGSVGRAEVEIGSRRVLTLLPLIGQFFGEIR
jgi:hypothetical protein